MSTYDSGLSQTRTASDPRLNEPLYGASLGQAIRRFFGKYAHFKGYASRSEYWWIQLFMAVIGGLISIPFLQTYDPVQGTFDLTQGTGNVEGLVLASSMAVFVWALATFIPFLALSWRRLHDAGFPRTHVPAGLDPGHRWARRADPDAPADPVRQAQSGVGVGEGPA